MDFSAALKAVKGGMKVSRRSWAQELQFIFWVRSSVFRYNPFGSQASSPYIGLRTTDGSVTPWSAPHTDLLAEDWDVV